MYKTMVITQPLLQQTYITTLDLSIKILPHLEGMKFTKIPTNGIQPHQEHQEPLFLLLI